MLKIRLRLRIGCVLESNKYGSHGQKIVFSGDVSLPEGDLTHSRDSDEEVRSNKYMYMYNIPFELT